MELRNYCVDEPNPSLYILETERFQVTVNSITNIKQITTGLLLLLFFSF